MLKIERLSKQYKNGFFALRDISFTVNEGDFVAILGSSGAGKSTLIRCINRLVEPTSGAIYWREENVLQYNSRELRQFRRQAGMIFQNFFLIERMSVLKNVLVGRFGTLPLSRILSGRFSENDIKEAYAALHTVGMDSFASRRVADLSGGQRQRVAIARALVQHPRFILGDEPVASLDPVTAKNVMDLLHDIRHRDSITMIINLHSVELAKAYATRIIGIAGGHVVFDGSPGQLNDNILRTIYVPDENTTEDPSGTTGSCKGAIVYN
ncbi:phosphonate ABC transporter ATP-binding protein [Paenibacillus filicis]|uniref:Phosphonate ABC transporter ATP-binding protein n=1 Tax=Paenibacillus gyeongsangnamensis TaxID=3388067 RepID=A0ABT4QJF8_9BACL|nr:phosphonate ABC transporter ATP-binding protein [Paenibacillus filicis]MCZ8516974.1 phosphonate ABC transporter ATP-binding protein [Paenibacillus filicis]